MEKFASSLLMAIMLMPIMANSANNAVNCVYALQKIIPCENYLAFGSSIPSTNCCAGVKDLANIANKSKSERQSLCECLKSAAKNFPINEEKAKALPKLCNVNLNITISPIIDCTRV